MAGILLWAFSRLARNELDARLYLDNLSKDTKRGLRDTVLREVTIDGRVYRGFSGGGFPPRGYRTVRVETGRRVGSGVWLCRACRCLG